VVERSLVVFDWECEVGREGSSEDGRVMGGFKYLGEGTSLLVLVSKSGGRSVQVPKKATDSPEPDGQEVARAGGGRAMASWLRAGATDSSGGRNWK